MHLLFRTGFYYGLVFCVQTFVISSMLLQVLQLIKGLLDLDLVYCRIKVHVLLAGQLACVLAAMAVLSMSTEVLRPPLC